MPVRAFLYDADENDREVELTEEIVCALNDRQLLWVDIQGTEKTEFERVVRLFDLPHEAVADIIRDSHRPELTNYGVFFTVCLKVLNSEAKSVATTELNLVVGANFLLTLHQPPVRFLENFDRTVRGDTPLGQLYAPAFLAVLLDGHLTDFFRVLERLEAEVDRMDDHVFSDEAEDKKLLSQLVKVRRDVARVRRILTPHREVYAALSRPDYLLFSDNEVAAYFKTLHERLEKTIDAIENVRELLVGSFEIYATRTAQRTNDIVKLLTVVTVSLMPISALAGILGMNFKSKVFDTGETGLIISLLVMVGVTTLTLIVARWRKWI
jgi:magnesium transporter